ncbi:TetR/AcrR family transcriptional regulator [Hoeflea sp. WL0058]|uniref:TetR/AcrR family transcriptional regulator n=1 Tax=Flavimaribacter sediminis TaxID=2865987 RepID=A0AAE2ZLB4_9HYPH|nr:TetR/AcrR family transcriptional regulator [Flavimaribacter sediminis]
MTKSQADEANGQRRRATLSRDAWIVAAASVLERRGISAVKIDVLARKLKVTRGSFYFHFKGLKDLHESLLDTWRTRNCRPFEMIAERTDLRAVDLFNVVCAVWVDERPFSPSLDLAVRDWSRTSRKLAAEMSEADDLRLTLLKRSFLEMGYSEDESTVRARTTYFHQIGYYAISYAEPSAERKRLQPIFADVLLGKPQ